MADPLKFMPRSEIEAARKRGAEVSEGTARKVEVLGLEEIMAHLDAAKAAKMKAWSEVHQHEMDKLDQVIAAINQIPNAEQRIGELMALVARMKEEHGMIKAEHEALKQHTECDYELHFERDQQRNLIQSPIRIVSVPKHE